MRHYAAIYGLVSVFFYLGTAIGGVAYGAIRDSLGSFSVALCLSTILLLGAGYLFLMLHQPVCDAPLSPAAT